jgi:hypothetical protein
MLPHFLASFILAHSKGNTATAQREIESSSIDEWPVRLLQQGFCFGGNPNRMRLLIAAAVRDLP